MSLDASLNCGIDDEGIKDLNLERLQIYDNSKITNANHMTKLKELDASDNCGIDDGGIKNLNLKKLNVYNNTKITNVNHIVPYHKISLFKP